MNKNNSVGNENYILMFLKKNILNSKSIPSHVKGYHEFCTFFRLKQLTKVPTRTATSSCTIIDYILANYLERVIDISMSDHQLIYCTKKISRVKRGPHKQTQFYSFRHF